MAEIERVGPFVIAADADIKKKGSNINYVGNDAVSHEGIQKYEGMLVISKVTTPSGADNFVFALSTGVESDSNWIYLDGDGTIGTVTPVA